MRRTQTLLTWVFAVVMATGVAGYPGPEAVRAADLQAGTWTGGGAVGFFQRLAVTATVLINFTDLDTDEERART